MKKPLISLLILVMWIYSCSEKDLVKEKSTQNELLGITLHVDNKTYSADSHGHNIWYLKVPKHITIPSLKMAPKVRISDKATVRFNKTVDYTKAFPITVISESNHSVHYSLMVHQDTANTSADHGIRSIHFNIGSATYYAAPNRTGTWFVNLPKEVDLSQLTAPDIQINPSSTYTPKGHTDFSKPVQYTVTAPNGTKAEYIINVSHDKNSATLSHKANMESIWFVIDHRVFFALENANGFQVQLPPEVTLADLPSPVVRVSEGATVAPKKQSDFSKPIQYTVTSSSGQQKQYTLHVSKAPVQKKQLNHKALIDQIWFVIDHQAFHAIEDHGIFRVKLPSNVDLKNLPTPVIKASENASLSPKKQTDFSSPVDYTIASEDQSTTNKYQLIVSKKVAQNSEKQFKKLNLTVDGKTYSAIQKSHHAYTFQLPFGTDLSSLNAPDIEVSPGASFKPQHQTDFRATTRYTITAQDGSTADYNISAEFLPNTSTEVHKISILQGSTQTIGRQMQNGDWVISLPNANTNLSQLDNEPVFELAPNATYYPKGITDFTKPVKYTIISQNGKTNSFYLHFTKQFVSEWTTPSGFYTVQLPLTDRGNYDFVVNWGDGNTDTITNSQALTAKHIYPKADTYRITIDGLISGFGFNHPSTWGGQLLITDIKQWGTLQLGAKNHNEGKYFRFCKHLQITAQDAPDLSTTDNLSYMFAGSKNSYHLFNSKINHWNVSHIKNMTGMFQYNSKFDQDLNNWNMQNVLYLGVMFSNAQAFNGNIDNWNTSQTRNMWGMFAGALKFNRDISRWHVDKVTEMQWMFYLAPAFTQDISHWDTRNVKNMRAMFGETPKLSLNLSSWNVTQVSDWRNFNQNSKVTPPAKFK